VILLLWVCDGDGDGWEQNHRWFGLQGFTVLGFRIQGLNIRVPEMGFRVQGLNVQVPEMGFRVNVRVPELGFRVQGFNVRVPKLGFRV